jgi:pentatricopeptide repeat protein
MKACTSLKKYSSALAIFEVAKQHKFKNISFFNAVLNIHHKKNQREQVEQVFREIFQEGLIPNTMTYNIMIDHYNKVGDFKNSENLLAIMSEKNIEPDNMTYGVIIDTCVLRGDLATAELTFKKMSGDGKEPTGLTYKAIFNAYVKFGEFSKAEKTWREMTAAKGFLPDASMSETMLRIYNADGTPDFLARGEKLYFQLKKNGVKLNDRAEETMVEVFMKLGKRALAQELFKELKEKGRVTGDTVEEMVSLRKPTKTPLPKE